MKNLVISSLLFSLFASILVSALTHKETSKNKDHKDMRVPQQLAEMTKDHSKSRTNESSQIWLRNVTTGPTSTTSVRQIFSPNNRRENSTYNFKKKQHVFHRQKPHATVDHEYALAIYDAEEGIYGAAATINLWNPSVEMGARGREYSAAKMRIRAGTDDDFDSIEVGWHVFPSYYTRDGDREDDDRTRFFISWTNDSYRRPCYNLDCGGFVVQPNGIALGSILHPTSLYEGDQRDMSVSIWKDHGRWLLKHDDTVVGYWPEELFTHLNTFGTKVEWGGVVLNRRNNNRFTSTKMGSGHFADEGYKRAAYFKGLLVKNANSGHNWIAPERIERSANNHEYYSMFVEADIDGFGNGGFFYGGPGHRNA